ncbi:hypothetical protein AURDEDRAFT_156668 [Auricularia subglabra TFB-10046 SS5]|nr:hypothetical protein AURDEDRAFT_156668 [Auricularia subglabra TFB-10046 SS5]
MDSPGLQEWPALPSSHYLMSVVEDPSSILSRLLTGVSPLERTSTEPDQLDFLEMMAGFHTGWLPRGIRPRSHELYERALGQYTELLKTLNRIIPLGRFVFDYAGVEVTVPDRVVTELYAQYHINDSWSFSDLFSRIAWSFQAIRAHPKPLFQYKYINDLPLEILINIAFLLDKESVYSLAATSKGLRRVCKDRLSTKAFFRVRYDMRIMHEPCIFTREALHLRVIEAMIAARARVTALIATLKLNVIRCQEIDFLSAENEWEWLWPDYYSRFLMLPGARDSQIFDPLYDDLIGLLPHLPSVTHLRLAALALNQRLIEYLAASTTITHLTLDRCSEFANVLEIPTYLSHMRNITHLAIGFHGDQYTHHTQWRLLSLFPNLRRVHAYSFDSGETTISYPYLHASLKIIHSLEVLHIQGSTSYLDELVSWLRTAAKESQGPGKLRKVKIHARLGIFVEDLLELLTALSELHPQLSTLVVEGIDYIPVVFLSTLLELLPNLESLSLVRRANRSQRCNKLCDWDAAGYEYARVLQGFKYLRHLEVNILWPFGALSPCALDVLIAAVYGYRADPRSNGFIGLVHTDDPDHGIFSDGSSVAIPFASLCPALESFAIRAGHCYYSCLSERHDNGTFHFKSVSRVNMAQFFFDFDLELCYPLISRPHSAASAHSLVPDLYHSFDVAETTMRAVVPVLIETRDATTFYAHGTRVRVKGAADVIGDTIFLKRPSISPSVTTGANVSVRVKASVDIWGPGIFHAEVSSGAPWPPSVDIRCSYNLDSNCLRGRHELAPSTTVIVSGTLAAFKCGLLEINAHDVGLDGDMPITDLIELPRASVLSPGQQAVIYQCIPSSLLSPEESAAIQRSLHEAFTAFRAPTVNESVLDRALTDPTRINVSHDEDLAFPSNIRSTLNFDNRASPPHVIGGAAFPDISSAVNDCVVAAPPLDRLSDVVTTRAVTAPKVIYLSANSNDSKAQLHVPRATQAVPSSKPKQQSTNGMATVSNEGKSASGQRKSTRQRMISMTTGGDVASSTASGSEPKRQRTKSSPTGNRLASGATAGDTSKQKRLFVRSTVRINRPTYNMDQAHHTVFAAGQLLLHEINQHLILARRASLDAESLGVDGSAIRTAARHSYDELRAARQCLGTAIQCIYRHSGVDESMGLPCRLAVERLNPDVLSEIFRRVVLAYDHRAFYTNHLLPPAFVLASVCSTWRQVALKTSSLWTKVRIPLHLDLYDALPYLGSIILERSKTNELDICILSAPGQGCLQLSQNVLATVARLLERCRAFQISWNDPTIHFSDSLLPALLSNMPFITEFIVKQHPDEARVFEVAGAPEHLPIFTLCPNLRVLELDCLPLNLIELSTMPNIEVFGIQSILTSRQLVAICQSWPRLRRFQHSSVRRLHAWEDKVVFSQLEHLACSSQGHTMLNLISRIHVPLLHSLFLNCHSEVIVLAFTTFINATPWPNIRTLTVTGLFAHHVVDWLPYLPRLDDLCLVKISTPGMISLLTAWKTQIMLSFSTPLTRLQLIDCGFGDSAVDSFLSLLTYRRGSNATPLLQDLVIVQGGITLGKKSFFPTWLMSRLAQLLRSAALSVSVFDEDVEQYSWIWP